MAVTNEQIRQVLAANPNATDDQLVKAMIKYGVTPSQLQQATGRDVSGIRQAFGGAGGYTDEQVRQAVGGRVGEQGFVTVPQVQRAAENYGISEEQLMRALPGYRPAGAGPYSTEQSGLMPGISALGRTRDDIASMLSGLRTDIGNLYGQAQEYQAPYREYGGQAARLQAALTGALGPEEQQAAMSQYMTSPAFDFLQQQQERAQLRNAAALGGLAGGNVRQELARLNAGLYAQDFQNQFARLGEIATRGYGAGATSAGLAGQQAGLVGQAGMTGAGLVSGLGEREALMRMQAGQDLSTMINQAAINQANAQMGLGQNISNIYGQGATDQRQFMTGLGDVYSNLATGEAGQRANTLGGMAGYAGGVSPGQMQPVPAYNIGQGFEAAGQGADFYRMMFPQNQGQQFTNYATAPAGYVQAGGPYMQSPSGLQYDPSFIRGLS